MSTESPRERLARLWRQMHETVAFLRGSSDTRHHYNGRYRIGETFAMSDGRKYTVAYDGSFRHAQEVTDGT